MNERIGKLAEQAGLLGPSSRIGNSHEATDRFAQLIVEECMRQVEEQYLPVLEDELMMKDTHWKGYVQCGVDSYVAIKEHFGVEE